MDKAQLLGGRNRPEVAVDIDGIGTIVVRGITRAEYLHAGKVGGSGDNVDPLRFERVVLAAAMVDPEMNEDDVAAWQKAAPSAEIQTVMETVMEASGLRQGADKSDVSAVRG